MLNEYDPTRTYCIQDEAPTSPIAMPNAFIIISDVKDEGLTEEKQQMWSYKQDRILSVTEYIKEFLIE